MKSIQNQQKEKLLESGRYLHEDCIQLSLLEGKVCYYFSDNELGAEPIWEKKAMADLTSPEWSTESVLNELKKQTHEGAKARIEVFLDESVPKQQVKETSAAIVEKSDPSHNAKLGKVKSLAKSFSVEADLDTLSRIARQPQVKTILPSQVLDIYPKPLDSTDPFIEAASPNKPTNGE